MPSVSLPSARLRTARRRPGPSLVGAALIISAGPALADVTSQSKLTENKDGTTSLVFSNEVSDLGAKVGINVTEPAVDSLADPVAGQEGNSGSAFAKVTAKSLPDWMIWQKNTVDVSVSPADETSKVATTFSRTVTINPGVKATLSDTYAVSRTGSEDSWETDKTLSVKLEDTSTTFSVGTKAAEGTDHWMPSLSASQQIVEGFKVTTTVADTGDTLNRSVTASFTHRW